MWYITRMLLFWRRFWLLFNIPCLSGCVNSGNDVLRMSWCDSRHEFDLRLEAREGSSWSCEVKPFCQVCSGCGHAWFWSSYRSSSHELEMLQIWSLYRAGLQVSLRERDIFVFSIRAKSYCCVPTSEVSSFMWSDAFVWPADAWIVFSISFKWMLAIFSDIFDRYARFLAMATTYCASCLSNQPLLVRSISLQIDGIMLLLSCHYRFVCVFGSACVFGGLFYHVHIWSQLCLIAMPLHCLFISSSQSVVFTDSWSTSYHARVVSVPPLQFTPQPF